MPDHRSFKALERREACVVAGLPGGIRSRFSLEVQPSHLCVAVAFLRRARRQNRRGESADRNIALYSSCTAYRNVNFFFGSF